MSQRQGCFTRFAERAVQNGRTPAFFGSKIAPFRCGNANLPNRACFLRVYVSIFISRKNVAFRVPLIVRFEGPPAISSLRSVSAGEFGYRISADGRRHPIPHEHIVATCSSQEPLQGQSVSKSQIKKGGGKEGGGQNLTRRPHRKQFLTPLT